MKAAIETIKAQIEATEIKFYEVRMSKYRSWIAEMNLKERAQVVNGTLTITNSLGSVLGTEIDQDTDLVEFFNSMISSGNNVFATKAEAIDRLIESHKEAWYSKYENSASKHHQADLAGFEKMYADWNAGKNI